MAFTAPTDAEGEPCDRFLQDLQRKSFDYFVHEVNGANGLVADKTKDDWPASIAAVGMALSAYPVGVHRGFMERTDAVARTLATLRFFAQSEQSDAVDATGYHGFYYHFLHMDSGKRAWQSELSSIDTAILIAGALAAGEYFDAPTAAEVEVRALAQLLYERVEWDWMVNPRRNLLRHGWKPETGYLAYHWEGYDEALILYLLALGSPTHGIAAECYPAWCASYEWKDIYGIQYLYAGPLFIHQMSHIWVDFRHIRDAFMASRGSDYFENSRRATLVQQQYAIANPNGIPHAGKWFWGVTASDGPGPASRRVAGVQRRFFDYLARGAPYGPDDGTMAPWAVVASLPFAPDIVVPTVLNFNSLDIPTANPYGFKASINPLFPVPGRAGIGWSSQYHFGINEGPVVLMIENYRSGLLWALMRQCAPLVDGLRRAGFGDGWLGAGEPMASEVGDRP